MFQIKVVEKIKTHILRSITLFFLENRAVYNTEKFIGAGEAGNDNVIQSMRFACWVSKATRARTRVRLRTHTHKRNRARAHTHTHIEICNIYCFSTATMVS
jgi:hypothetical protein